MLVVPDDVLNQFICDNCYKYLSCNVVIPDNENSVFKKLCGRCGVITTQRRFRTNIMQGIESFLKRSLSKHLLFKCINRFDGCGELLTSDEVQQHELQCRSSYHVCYLCKFSTAIEKRIDEDISKLPGYEFPYHLKTEHQKSFLPTSTIEKYLNELEVWNIFYYLKDDYIFFIFLKFKRRDQIFLIRVFYIGGGNRKKFLKIDGKIQIESEMMIVLCFESKSLTKNIGTIVEVDQLLLDNAKVVFSFDFSFSPCTLSQCEKKMEGYVIENYRRLRQIQVKKDREIVLNTTKTKLLFTDTRRVVTEINVECVLCRNVTFDNIFITDNGNYRNLLCKWCAYVYKSPFEDLQHFCKSNLMHIMHSLTFSCIWGCGSVFAADSTIDMSDGTNRISDRSLTYHELFLCKSIPVQECPFETCYYKGTLREIMLQSTTLHNKCLFLQNFCFITKTSVEHAKLHGSYSCYLSIDQAFIHVKITTEQNNSEKRKTFTIEITLIDVYQDYSSVTAIAANNKNIINSFSTKCTYPEYYLPLRLHIVPTLLMLSI